MTLSGEPVISATLKGTARSLILNGRRVRAFTGARNVETGESSDNVDARLDYRKLEGYTHPVPKRVLMQHDK